MWLESCPISQGCAGRLSAVSEMLYAPCQSYGPRRAVAAPEVIVLHYTAMHSAQAALERLCDPDIEVSAHYLIAEDGCVWSMVPEDMRAWHAGAGQWRNIQDVNSHSIGIELANCGDHPFSEPQMYALETLMQDVMARWGIAPIDVIGHSDMAPDRKIDPGPRFDWRRLARQGLSIWPDGVLGPEIDVAQFCTALHRFGYPECPFETLLNAMRLRFRPWGRGPLASEDMAIATALARLR